MLLVSDTLGWDTPCEPITGMIDQNFCCPLENDADCEFEFNEATGPDCDCHDMIYDIAHSGGTGVYLTSTGPLDDNEFSTLETWDPGWAGLWESYTITARWDRAGGNTDRC